MTSNDSFSTEREHTVNSASGRDTGTGNAAGAAGGAAGPKQPSEAVFRNPGPNAGARTLSFMSIQRLLTKRRLWVLAGTILYMIMYYPVATILLISSSNHYAQVSNTLPETALADRLTTVSSWLGLRQSFTFMAVIFGMILAIQGFSWLFSNEKTDFYNSQPFTARQRFTYVFVNGILIFTIPLIICTALALGAASAMDAMNGAILRESLICMVRLIVLFLSSYGFSILAVMMAGRGIYAAIMAAIMLLSEPLINLMWNACAGTFLRTWYYGSLDRWPALTPIYAIGAPQWTLSQHNGWDYDLPGDAMISGILSDMIPADLTSLAVGMICLAAGVYLFRKRKAESAGGSVIYKPARVIFFLFTAIYAGLVGGLLVHNIFSTGRETERMISVVPVIAAAVVAVITGAVIQAVYDRDLRKCLAHIWQHALSAAAAVGIFLVFCLDLTGYDNYVPKASDVSDAALISGYEQSFSYPDVDVDGNTTFGIYGSDHTLKEMKITDLDALLRIAEAGMAQQRSNEIAEYGTGWNAVIKYHLKNGRNVLRQITIPYDIDAADMDAVVGSREYKETVFPVYLEESTEKMNTAGSSISFSRNGSTRAASGDLYPAFAQAYKSDLEKYDYTLASNECSIGEISTSSKDFRFSETYEIYPSFTNTIKFLKDNGLYIEDFTADDIDEIAVLKTDVEDDYSTWYANFTDKEQLAQILAHCERTACNVWKQTTAQKCNYSVQLSIAGKKSSVNCEYNFIEGDIPAFVEEAMRPAADEAGTREEIYY